MPVAVLLPLRGLFSRHSVVWPCVAAGFLAFVMPRVAGFLHRVTGEGLPGQPAGGLQIFVAMCAVPVLTWWLRAIPPLSLLQEDRE